VSPRQDAVTPLGKRIQALADMHEYHRRASAVLLEEIARLICDGELAGGRRARIRVGERVTGIPWHVLNRAVQAEHERRGTVRPTRLVPADWGPNLPGWQEDGQLLRSEDR